ncbi:CDP-glycerol glycerophosphotransferase family protein [Peptostreptococcus faecalis]|uniref:CDP-glycerol glycerophosphotransferase family protein n=1 Tax=Peptostreptococcus faecalis TaxID=2045015 RepID=UPI000C7E1262|nr:CDP-glycerol glycerophosphotransferase family protein [Peptostreptococcus faecalis]
MSKINKVVRLSKQAIDMLKFNELAKKYKDDKKYTDMWLISERGVEAKDNGYVFFKYLRESHPEINAWYVIDSSCTKDYNKVKDLGNIIEYNSDEHKVAFINCKYAISTHTGFLEPWSYKLYKMILDRKDKKFFVFLQHGVMMNDASKDINHKNMLDLFITTTKRECEDISGDHYGFKKGVVVQTGLARYDRLNEFSVKNQILLMPTWRKGIITPSYLREGIGDEEVFRNSDYFKSLNSLINNKKLINMLEENKADLIFYPHYEMQPYKSAFEISSDRVVIADKGEFDVQELLKESKLMITDFSSVAFDFAYMRKPIIYYQNIPDDRYLDGYFNYATDGFGDIVIDEDKLVSDLENYFENNFVMDDKYLNRVNMSFNMRDDKNSERIYNEIIKLKK